MEGYYSIRKTDNYCSEIKRYFRLKKSIRMKVTIYGLETCQAYSVMAVITICLVNYERLLWPMLRDCANHSHPVFKT